MKLFFLIAVVCTLISQMPVLLGTTVGSVLKLTWLLPFAIMLFRYPKDLYCKPLKYVYYLLALFIVYCFLLQSVSGETYFGADAYNMLLSFFICIISYSFWKHNGDSKTIISLSFFVLIVSAYVGYFIYVSADLVSALDSSQYAAARSKNSLSTILLSAALFGFLFFVPKRRFWQYVGYFLEIVLVLIMILLRSRATILGFAFVLLYFLFKSKNRKIKVSFWILCIGVVAYMALHPSLWQTVMDNIVYAGRDSGDLNELSSGRFDMMFYLAKTYYKSFLLGIGCYYFDCMPFVMVLQYGILGSGIVFAILWKLGKQLCSFDKRNPVFLCAFLLYWVFMLNSAFEAQPPFGPGAKCFLLWVSVGFALAENESVPLAVNE